MRPLLLACLVLLGCARADKRVPTGAELPEPDALLHLVDSVASPASDRPISKRALVEAHALELVSGFDPYYKRQKRFWAVPLAQLLARGLPGADLSSAEILVTAKDGYAVSVSGSLLGDGSAYLALADADQLSGGQGGWESVGPQRGDAAPFYLVWKGSDRVDLDRYPRPWGIERIERVRTEGMYPHTIPEGSPEGSPARRGCQIYRVECIRCHAINREGGRVGPDLNVPQSIVEYRPREQIRDYIRNPLKFRYSLMPAHPGLSDEDLDALLAYFDAMRTRKHDPERAVTP